MIVPGYEQRYCAFIDILGFRELIGKLDRGELSFLTLMEMLDRIHRPARARVGDEMHQFSELRAQSISDAVAISTACTSYGLLLSSARCNFRNSRTHQDESCIFPTPIAS
jgi:hypothetical protein